MKEELLCCLAMSPGSASEMSLASVRRCDLGERSAYDMLEKTLGIIDIQHAEVRVHGNWEVCV